MLTYEVSCLFYFFTFKKLIIETQKNWRFSKMAGTLFEIEIDNEINTETKEKLPIELFQELDVELLDSLLHKDNNKGEISDDETDGPIDFIRQIADRVRKEFDEVVKKGERKTFIHLFTKILANVLSVKADNIEKIVNLVKLTISKVLKTRSERN